MKRNKISIQTADGVCEAWEVLPASGDKSMPVLMYMDAIGVREAQLAHADYLAAQGFYVLVPNLFYREHALPLTDYPETFSKNELGAFFLVLKDYMARLTPQKLLEDAHFYLGHLKEHGPVRIIGFCFGGGHGVRTAATYPETVSHVVSLHGGQLASEAESAPIRYLNNVKASLYFGHADHDSSMPLPMIQQLETELRKLPIKSVSKIFKDAHHGFTMVDLPAYNREASVESLKEAVQFFKN
jgi:carboxymethylenebutenolidase